MSARTSLLRAVVLTAPLLLLFALPAAAQCSACSCSCSQTPCGCWCLELTGECECFRCGPMPVSMDLPDLSGSTTIQQAAISEATRCANALADFSLEAEASSLAVYFGASGEARYLEPEARQHGTYSQSMQANASFDLSLHGLDARAAVILVADATDLDLVLPHDPALAKPIDLQLTAVGWDEALALVMDAAGSELRPVRSPSGLVFLE